MACTWKGARRPGARAPRGGVRGRAPRGGERASFGAPTSTRKRRGRSARSRRRRARARCTRAPRVRARARGAIGCLARARRPGARRRGQPGLCGRRNVGQSCQKPATSPMDRVRAALVALWSRRRSRARWVASDGDGERAGRSRRSRRASKWPRRRGGAPRDRIGREPSSRRRNEVPRKVLLQVGIQSMQCVRL